MARSIRLEGKDRTNVREMIGSVQITLWDCSKVYVQNAFDAFVGILCKY